MIESSNPQQRSSPSRAGRRRNARRAAVPYMSLQLAAVFATLVVLQIVSNTDQATMQAASPQPVVRVLRVDVPPVVRSHDAKPEPGKPVAPLLFGCTYALEGGENDDENGETTTVTTTTVAATTASSTTRAAAVAGSDAGRGERSAPELQALDAAMETLQKERGVVVKWYFRRNPTPAAGGDPLASYIDDSVQVYQWLAGSGSDGSVGLGPLSGRTVDVTAEMPRGNKSVLHRVFRVERPTAELTGEYRCQVEDWVAERRSAWQPMVVYTPERVFKISVDDNDDDDENDMMNTEDSGEDGNSTTQEPSSSTTIRGGAQQPSAASKDLPTEINITCYAAGVHPEPSMSIWVNGLMQDSVTTVVTVDDGDDDETNDDDGATSTTSSPTTTTARPKVRGRYRANRDDVVYRNYAVRAAKVVQLKDVDDRRKGKYTQPKYRNAVDVECRLRVPGDGAGDGHWKADRPPGHYYGARQSKTYNVRRPGDSADAAVYSASKTDDEDEGDVDTPSVQGSTNGARSTGPVLSFVLLQSAFTAVAALAVGRLQ